MEYKIIALKEMDYGEYGKKENANIALILRGDKRKEYAVVRNLDVSKPMTDNNQWDNTIEYYQNDIVGLQKAIECYRFKTEDNYISRQRLEEIATKFKDTCFEIGGITEIEDSTVGESLILSCDLEEHEISFFEIPKEAVEELETTKEVMNMFM